MTAKLPCAPKLSIEQKIVPVFAPNVEEACILAAALLELDENDVENQQTETPAQQTYRLNLAANTRSKSEIHAAIYTYEMQLQCIEQKTLQNNISLMEEKDKAMASTEQTTDAYEKIPNQPTNLKPIESFTTRKQSLKDGLNPIIITAFDAICSHGMQYIAIGYNDGAVELWEECRRKIINAKPHTDVVTNIKFCGDVGLFSVSLDGKFVVTGHDNVVKHCFVDLGCSITAMAIESSTSVFIGGVNGIVMHLDLTGHAFEKVLTTDNLCCSPVRSITLTPSPHRNAKNSKVKNANGLKSTARHTRTARESTSDPTVSILLISHGIGRLLFYDMRDQKHFEFADAYETITNVVVRQDMIYAAVNETVRVYELNDPQCVAVLNGMESSVQALCHNRDHLFVITFNGNIARFAFTSIDLAVVQIKQLLAERDQLDYEAARQLTVKSKKKRKSNKTKSKKMA